MSDQQQYREIVITVSDVEITLKTISEVPIEYNKDKTKLQSSVARALQRVLRSYKFGNSKDKIFDHEDYILFGKLLCEILIGKTVRGFIKMALMDAVDSESKSLKQRCRIYLQFTPQIDEELALLPWEYIFTEFELEGIEPMFLAADLQGQFDLIRRTKDKALEFKPLEMDLTGDEPVLFTPGSAKKILIIFVVVQLEKIPTDQIKDLKTDFQNKNFIVREINNPTYSEFADELDKILKAEKDNISSFIIHYYGHAKVEDNCGQISLMNSDRTDHDWILDTQFADLFQAPARRPQIFVLQACSSGQIVRYTPNEKHGIALLLSLKEIPAVVAMQNDVNVLDSFAFIENFYDDLFKGNDVAQAVTRGRQYLGSKYLEASSQTKYSTNAFGAPILFIATKTPIRLIKKIEMADMLTGDEGIKNMFIEHNTGKAQSEVRKPSENISQEKAERPNTDNDMTKAESAK